MCVISAEAGELSIHTRAELHSEGETWVRRWAAKRKGGRKEGSARAKVAPNVTAVDSVLNVPLSHQEQDC